jgi:predicted unusual protein kinase regulating ubiquinone biosynthesis (AarF/ABC1/UbiB family)
VYRATLKDGQSVAVKVQRPQMLEAVTLDLFASRLVFALGTNIAP